ncbi:MAG: hypothetical protein PHW12_05645, partial [Smithella sp.]|nr:hypothetical protein [Smithella sp.]
FNGCSSGASIKYALKTSTPYPRQRGTFEAKPFAAARQLPLPPPAGHSSLRTTNICYCDTVSCAGQASQSETRRVGEQPDNLKVTRGHTTRPA